MTAVVAVLGLTVVVLAVLVVGLLRSHADILRALHDLGIDLDPSSASGTPRRQAVPTPTPGPVGSGMVVPSAVSGHDPAGGSTSVALLGEDRLTLIAFLSSGCLTCRPMWEALGAADIELPGGARAVAVTKGPHEESPASVQALASSRLTTVMSSEAWEAFAVPGSPYFVLVDGAGTVVGEGTAGTWERVVGLLGEALADGGAATGRLGPPPDPGRGGSAQARHHHVDQTLRAAGIEAGHSSLYPEQVEGEP